MQLDSAKERLRTRLLETRREMTFEDVWERSALIQKRLVKSAVFQRARSIALYSSCQNEVLTDAIFSAAGKDEKDVYYPRVFRGRDVMVFLPVLSLDELTAGAFDVREPRAEAEKAIDPGTLDLVVLPGVAFDRRGARLGFGKGYYDRALEGSEKPLLLALAYDFQVVETVPTGPHDVRMDALVTETGYIKRKE